VAQPSRGAIFCARLCRTSSAFGAVGEARLVHAEVTEGRREPG
jgi:hypothetical protein